MRKILSCPPILHGRPPLHLDPGSTAKIRHPAQIAATDSVDLHQTHQAGCATLYYNCAMRRDAEGSPAPVRASPAPVQPQKPKTVSGGRSRPAGRRAQRGQRSGTHPKSPPIEARTEIPSALTITTTTAPSLPSAQHRGRWANPSTAPASSAQGGEARERRGTGQRTIHMPQLRLTTHVRLRSHSHGPSPAHPSGG